MFAAHLSKIARKKVRNNNIEAFSCGHWKNLFQQHEDNEFQGISSIPRRSIQLKT